MKKTILSCLLISSVAFAKGKSQTPANCDLQFKKEKLCATLTWTKKPVVVQAPTAKDAAAFDLRLWDMKGTSSGPFKDLGKDQTLLVSLYMPEMGHGSEPVTLKKDEKEPGLYHVTQVLFSMEGAWEIRGRILKNGKDVDKAAFPFNFK